MISARQLRARLSLWRFLPRMVRMAGPWRRHAVGGIGAWVFSALLSLLYPVVLGRYIDQVLREGRLEALPGLAVFVGAIILLRAGGDIMRTFLLSRARESTTAAARLDLHARILQSPLPLIEKHKSAALHDRVMRDLASVTGLLFNSGPRFIQSAALALGSLVVVFFMDWQLALLGLLFVPPFAVIMLIWVRRLRPRYKTLWEQRSQLGATLQQHYSGARVLQAFNRQDWAVDRARDEQTELADSTVRLQRESALFGTAPSVVIGGGLLVLLYVGARRVTEGSMAPGALTTLIATLAIFAGATASIVALANTLQQSLASAERVFEIADMAPANDILGVAACDRTSPATLVFEQLAFAYPSRNEDVPDRPVLRNVSLWIEPGETAALVGSSGAGKTTTASLLARFLEPSKGRILWGNQSIDGMPLAHWRNHLAIVHQEDWLLAATVRENMALGREDVSEQDIFEALDISCARALVEALPDQLDTLIGERGHDLSGGERQRLCLARALIGRPQLLILDEATAALDLKTEHIIFQNLSRLSWRPTVLLISHRLTAIAAAQTIHVLDEGRIVESGTHEELLATGRYYAEMLQLQQNREVEA